ncbi:hypothetical protein HETIRDRAFT_174538 [Heterobasidion irregulare TC 32-1]|uniref:Uncharacterized protein n=1 Tax=Heterobasidion irregulare (strain TC 32-1) TaxID=747525 RepID=W4JU99_HETIT|nr:uncharacterized protein HETIRDRAFT_174538 [Heterobasidion irregulare TC 32-1]ETW76451.1 hypothetical protein HETIRDRAFT_174538 [Heterobasidion irregulare TC 32-1]
MSLTLRTELQVELLTAFLNTRGPRAILSSDSYPLDHSPIVIELLFGTLSVLVASLSLRSTFIFLISSRSILTLMIILKNFSIATSPKRQS